MAHTHPRHALVNRTADGDRLGVAIVLGDADLDALGIAPDVDQVEYAFVDGELVVGPVLD